MKNENNRSMNAEMREGMSDGTFKKLNIDRGGEVESSTARIHLALPPQYGVEETWPKEVFPMF